MRLPKPFGTAVVLSVIAASASCGGYRAELIQTYKRTGQWFNLGLLYLGKDKTDADEPGKAKDAFKRGCRAHETAACGFLVGDNRMNSREHPLPESEQWEYAQLGCPPDPEVGGNVGSSGHIDDRPHPAACIMLGHLLSARDRSASAEALVRGCQGSRYGVNEAGLDQLNNRLEVGTDPVAKACLSAAVALRALGDSARADEMIANRAEREEYKHQDARDYAAANAEVFYQRCLEDPTCVSSQGSGGDGGDEEIRAMEARHREADRQYQEELAREHLDAEEREAKWREYKAKRAQEDAEEEARRKEKREREEAEAKERAEEARRQEAERRRQEEERKNQLSKCSSLPTELERGCCECAVTNTCESKYAGGRNPCVF